MIHKGCIQSQIIGLVLFFQSLSHLSFSLVFYNILMYSCVTFHSCALVSSSQLHIRAWLSVSISLHFPFPYSYITPLSFFACAPAVIALMPWKWAIHFITPMFPCLRWVLHWGDCEEPKIFDRGCWGARCPTAQLKSPK